MSRRTLKLGAVLLGVGGPGQHNTWLDPEIPANASVDINWYIARAQEAEAAKFDLVFIVDSQFITENSPNHYLSDEHYDYATRYGRAAEHVRVAQGLWDSPILRERGVVRSEYESTTLRGNLGLPVPENRHTAASTSPPALVP